MNTAGTSPSHNILTGQTERIAAVSPRASVRVLAKIVVVVSFLVIVAGELSHDTMRLTAITHALLYGLLALLVQIKEPRRFMKRLAWAGFAISVLQVLFGDFIGNALRPPMVAMSYGILSQSVLCIALALSIFSSHTWFRDLANPMIVHAENLPYMQFMKFATIIIFAQAIVGTGVRHSNNSGDHFLPFIMTHIGGAFMVIFVVTWFNLRTWHVYKDVTPMRRAAVVTACMIGVQLILGILAIFVNRTRLDVSMAQWYHVLISIMHLIVGTSLLGVMFGSTLRAHRILDHTNYSPSPGQAYQSREVLEK